MTDDNQITSLINYFETKTKIPEGINNIFNDLFLKYACIGGFPEAIQKYLKTFKIVDAYNITNNIVSDMKLDFERRKDKNGNPIFKPSEVARIQSVFNLIPTFLSKENKRFIVSKISGNNSQNKLDAIEYLKQSHIISKVYNLNIPSLPLIGEKLNLNLKFFLKILEL